MKLLKSITVISIALFVACDAAAQSQLPSCVGKDARRWTNCQGVHNFANGDRYEGEFRDGKFNGWRTYYHLANDQYRGDKYIGQFLNGARQGSGRYTSASSADSLEGMRTQHRLVALNQIGSVYTTC